MVQPDRKTIDTASVSPFAEATRTPVSRPTADLGAAEAVASPARVLQSTLEASLDGTAAIATGERYSPRIVTASVVTVCLAFWLALYLAAAAIL